MALTQAARIRYRALTPVVKATRFALRPVGKPVHMLRLCGAAGAAAIQDYPSAAAAAAAARDEINDIIQGTVDITPYISPDVAPYATPTVVRPIDSAIDGTVDVVVDVVRATGDVVKSGISIAEAGASILKQGLDAASPYVTSAINAISPAVESTVRSVSPVVEQALRSATPVVQQAVRATGEAASPAVGGAQQALGASLSNPAVSAVVGTAGRAVDTLLLPLARQLGNAIVTAEPVTLGQYALLGLALYFVLPPVLGAVGGSLRGYSGTMPAPIVLATLSDDNSSLLIDIRSEKDKELSGVPDLPNPARKKLVEVELAMPTDKKLRSAMRDPSRVAATVTALQIASLKGVSKRSKIALLDRYDSGAVIAVAKELCRRGFGRVYTVAGGFDGRGGWVQSKLQIKPAATMLSAPPPRMIGTSVRKSLPAPRS